MSVSRSVSQYRIGLEAAVRAVRKLHAPVGGWCDHCGTFEFPCPTIRAIDEVTGKSGHEHIWEDTGFADLDECSVCGVTRSTDNGSTR